MRRIILTEDERDLVRMIDFVKLDCKMQKEINGKVPLNRVFDLVNLNSMLVGSLLKRTECNEKISKNSILNPLTK